VVRGTYHDQIVCAQPFEGDFRTLDLRASHSQCRLARLHRGDDLGRVAVDGLLAADDEIVVTVAAPDGSVRDAVLKRTRGYDWGIVFADALFDGVRSCNNSCTFCFMTQLPPGLRPSLYVRDDDFRLTGLECLRMELGEPDESGRRSPVKVPGSNFFLPFDAVIHAIGNSPNPLIPQTTSGLELGRKGTIKADEKGATSRKGVYAGGDIVTGAATVILAMGAGKVAARAIDSYLKTLV